MNGAQAGTLPASAKPIQHGDLVCILAGATEPTIIRLCEDHFDIIMIAISPTGDMGVGDMSIELREVLRSIKAFPHDFPLVWDWEMSPEKSQKGEDGNSKGANSQAVDHLKTDGEDHLDRMTRLWNAALILKDAEEYEEAEKRLRELIDG